MELLRISAVSYLNTFPFVYGIKESGFLKNFRLELDVPSICAEKIKHGMVDIALVPAGALPVIGQFHHISDFCIGATGEVKTVLLLSRVPVDQIKSIHLDFDSRTSVELVKILAKHHWHIAPRWESMKAGHAALPGDIESLVAIGDKTFRIRREFPYIYDLATAWINFAGLPFVFANWVSRTILPNEVLRQFSRAISFGIAHKRESIDFFSDKLPACEDCLGYLENNISYEFDESKKEGLKLFLSFLEENKLPI